MTPSPTPLESTLDALCDEVEWSLRMFYAAKVVYEQEVRLTRTLFDTFYWACLDDAHLILSRLLIPNKDKPVNLYFLFEQAQQNPAQFRFATTDQIEAQIAHDKALLQTYQPLMAVLKEQRDKNLAHLDRKHVTDPEWRAQQPRLNSAQTENLYGDLVAMLTAYHSWFYGATLDFGNWNAITQEEIKALIAYFEAYQAQT